jgi:hypothetical protein
MRTAILSATIVMLSLTSRQAVAEEKPQYRGMPWHLVDLRWDLGKDRDFHSYAIDFTISDDVPDDVNLYIALLQGRFGETTFYGGVQTDMESITKGNRTRRQFGRGVIYSRWEERDVDAIRPAPGGIMDSSGHEGNFIGARRKYAWQAGSYTYKLVAMDRQYIGEQAHTWVGCFVRSHEKDEEEYMGALRFEGEQLILKRGVAAFVEIYGRRQPIEKIPSLTVTFGDIRVNGKSIESRTARAHYPPGVPDYADAEANGKDVVVEVGKPVKREARQERLY